MSANLIPGARAGALWEPPPLILPPLGDRTRIRDVARARALTVPRDLDPVVIDPDLRWTCIVIDDVSVSGVRIEQDLTSEDVLGYDAARSVIHPVMGSKPKPSNLFLTFPMATPNLNIKELMEVHIGWRNTTTNVWSVTDPFGRPDLPYGGRILSLRERTWGGEKEFECRLVGYNFDIARTKVLGWPAWVGPGQAVQGYPPGYPVDAWLRGGGVDSGGGYPHAGVLRQRLAHYNLLNFDPIFAEIILTADVLPGNAGPGLVGTGGVPGQFGFMMLDKVILAILDAARWAYALQYGGSEFVPDWWVGAFPASQTLVPTFYLRNVVDQGVNPDWVVASDADEALGEVQARHPWWHSRDAEHVQTVPVMVGASGDPTLPPDPVTGALPLTWAYGYNADHARVYPKYYERSDGPDGLVPPGWTEDIVVESRLHTIALAQQLADLMEEVGWGALGNILMQVAAPISTGQRVLYRDANEGYNTVFPVNDAAGVEGELGVSLREVILGFQQISALDKLKAGLPAILLTKEDLAFRMGQLLQRTVPGLPPQVPIEMTPTHPERNGIEPLFTDTPGMTIHVPARTRPVGPGLPDFGGPRNTWQVVGPRTEGMPPRTWTDPDGRPHPNSFPLLFTAAGTAGGCPDWDIVIARVRVKGTGSVSLLKNSVLVAGPFTTAGVHVITPPILISAAANDDFTIVVTGVVGNFFVTPGEP